MDLNEQQQITILTEGINRGFYECPNNAVPTDPVQRSEDAKRLVEACKLAYKNGNHSDNVNTILFVAECDMKPEVPNISSEPSVTSSAPKSAKNNVIDGFDITTVTDGILESLLVGLDKYPQNEQVQHDREIYLAEKARRSGESPKEIQEIPQTETGSQVAQKAGEIAPEGSPSTNGRASEHTAEAEGSNSGGSAPDGGTGGSARTENEDAGAFARAQTPETQPEGKKVKAKPIEKDEQRLKVESELTLPIVKAHGIDITNLDNIPTADLEYIVANPDGPSAEKGAKVVIREEELEPVPTQDVGSVVGGISAEVSAPEVIVSKESMGLQVDNNETSGEISAEREKLESQITGPLLKAYGQGRKSVPSIGDNELKFMLEHPDGRVTKDELESAKALDNSDNQGMIPGQMDIMMESEKSAGAGIEKIPKEIVRQKQFEKEQQEIAQKGSEKEQEELAKSPPTQKPISLTPAQVAAQIEKPDGWEVKDITPNHQQQQNRAMEIINREAMPIPPAYSDEDAPKFPIDVSVISRDELFSLHAKFHAYEIRMNYVLMFHEDDMNDCTKLREIREAVVAKSIPFMGEDNKRNTNEFREAQVKGDEKVIELGEQEHEARKLVADLKVFRNSFHLDCERLSRQMSKYENERLDAPR
jgi:hypothetical protein